MYIRYTITHKPEEVSQNHFQVLSVNIVSYDANWHSTMHHHNFAEIFYCLDGSDSFNPGRTHRTRGECAHPGGAGAPGPGPGPAGGTGGARAGGRHWSHRPAACRWCACPSSSLTDLPGGYQPRPWPR